MGGSNFALGMFHLTNPYAQVQFQGNLSRKAMPPGQLGFFLMNINVDLNDDGSFTCSFGVPNPYSLDLLRVPESGTHVARRLRKVQILRPAVTSRTSATCSNTSKSRTRRLCLRWLAPRPPLRSAFSRCGRTYRRTGVRPDNALNPIDTTAVNNSIQPSIAALLALTPCAVLKERRPLAADVLSQTSNGVGRGVFARRAKIRLP